MPCVVYDSNCIRYAGKWPMTLHEALAELLLAYSQKVKDWTPSEVNLVARCKEALEISDAMDREELSQAQQEAEREEREARREGRERHPSENWERGLGNPRR
jgi:hypothetical protein